MATIKEFKTYNEQLEILKNRGLIIENDSRAKSLLFHMIFLNNMIQIII